MRCILAKALDHACVPSRLSPSIISPLSHPSLPSSRQLFSAFDSVPAFCFRRSSISAFRISVSVSFQVLSLSHLLFYSVLVLVVFVSCPSSTRFPPRFGRDIPIICHR